MANENKRISKARLLIVVVLILYAIFLIWRAVFVYVPGHYVCKEMARDLESALEGAGLDVKICRGVSNFMTEGHAWVAISFNGFLLHIDSVGWYPFVPELLFHDIEVYEGYDNYLNATSR